MLRYNTGRFDYAAVIRALRYYYPIGIMPGEGQRYDAHIATLKRMALIGRKFKSGFYDSRWMPFQQEVSKRLHLPVQDVTYGEDAGYGAAIVLEETKGTGFERRKLLCFFASMLGPFSVIAGIDQSAVTVNGTAYFTYNLLTVSPENEYKAYANTLLQLMKQRFPDHRLLPFQVWSQVVEGLELPGEGGPCSVFEALFNEVLQIERGKDGVIKNVPIVGDASFGMEDWKVQQEKRMFAAIL